ncbi:MAG TPA: hypothetical protein VFU76_11035 [Terriglobales bacterium]|nr:hypothetical protein [Terriglobales bacterium]
MAGFLHIFRISTEKSPDGKDQNQYQVTLSIGGNNYLRVYDEMKLGEFLTTKAVLDPETFDRAMKELHLAGHTTIGNVGIDEYETPALGLEQVPADY